MLMKEEIEALQSGFSSPWGGLSWYRRKCDEEMEVKKGGKLRITRKIPSADPTESQLISKCLFGVIIWTKIATKILSRFLP